jgi:hypothetical protein
MATLPTDDLIMLYARLNAHEHLITVCVATIMQIVGGDLEAGRKAMLTAAMDLADRQELRPGERSVELGHEVQIQALRIVADFFESLKRPGGETTRPA